MKTKFITFFILLFTSLNLHAEEGMWLPSLIGETKFLDMQKKGLKLTADDLYSINNSSLKDAIALLPGCTGEIISKEGLMLTNHHCGYGSIQSHSTVEKDYLTDGFWAMNRKEELPVSGYKASFLVKMEDVTFEVEKGLKQKMSKQERRGKIAENILKIVKSATKNSHYNADVKSLYESNQYFLYVYETFTDVRLVGAPPSAIGKFGGDTDNWMWPRHTGDFCLFRIYASKDNKPAGYSADNVPYTPKRSLTISTKGVEKGDFTFIYGYPGRTNEYLISDAVKYIANINPYKIKLRTMRLDVMNSHQSSDAGVRIKYASKNAGVANAWKKWIGETDGIRKLNVISKKETLEEQFIEWAKDKPQYQNLLTELKGLYSKKEQLAFSADFYNESFNTIEILNFGSDIKKEATVNGKSVKNKIRAFFKNYYEPIDREIAEKLISEFKTNVDSKYIIKDIDINTIFNNTILTDSSKLIALADNTEEFLKVLNLDSAIQLKEIYSDFYKTSVARPVNEINEQINELYKTYMKGLMEMQPNKIFYPDANSTLRIAYGNVDGFNPRDGVKYDHQSTLEGIIEKDNPEIYDYKVPQRLKELYNSKDYGRWAVNGTIPVAFIATNHTTGGNSGSPVLNANGELIGLNFDRCWESTMSDIVYDKDLCRNIAVDARFILFVIDKYANAGHLINEMDLN